MNSRVDDDAFTERGTGSVGLVPESQRPCPWVAPEPVPTLSPTLEKAQHADAKVSLRWRAHAKNHKSLILFKTQGLAEFPTSTETSPLLHLVSCMTASVFVYLLARPLSRKSSQSINHSSPRPADPAAEAGIPVDTRHLWTCAHGTEPPSLPCLYSTGGLVAFYF